ERVVRCGGTLGDRLTGGVGKLVAAADDEGVEGVARIELRGAVPIKAGLRSRGGTAHRDGSIGSDDWAETAIMAKRSGCRVVVGSDKLHVGVFEAEIIDGFLDQVRILIAHMPELDGRNAHEENTAGRVTVASRLQPCVIGGAE